MLNSDARIVRGLNIAIIILSALALTGSLLGFIFLGIGGAAATDPGLTGEIARNLNADPDVRGYTFQGSDVAGLAGFVLAFIGLFAGWFLVCSIVTLIAGIIGLRSAAQPEKLGMAFGWAIAGAVVSFLKGSLISMALFIISAVYLNRLRHPAQPLYPQSAYGYGQQGYGQDAYYAPQTPPQGSQPGYGASQPDFSAPQTPPQSAQPQQPTTPEQDQR